MFSGLIHQLGQVVHVGRHSLAIAVKAEKNLPQKGDSVAVNGVCLTVVSGKRKGRGFAMVFDLSEETLKNTTLNQLKPGQPVNIEYALKAQEALGGHIVQGHVDGIGVVHQIRKRSSGMVYWFKAPQAFMRYIVPKGSIAVDGVSLTAVQVKKRLFSTSIIPYTLKHTNLERLKRGDKVNLETDIMAKYIEKYIKYMRKR